MTERINVRCCCTPGKILGTLPDYGRDMTFCLSTEARFNRGIQQHIGIQQIHLLRRQISSVLQEGFEWAYNSNHSTVETLSRIPEFRAGDSV